MFEILSRYDFMGDMVFGGGFETMRDGAKNDKALRAIRSGLKSVVFSLLFVF